MTAEFNIPEPIKQTLKKLTPDQVKEYARNNVFHLKESIGIYDSILEDLMKTFSEDQRKALFQGITEMKDKEQSFRQLFCCLSHTRKTVSLVYESFPAEYFINYFQSNLNNIQGMKKNDMEKPLLALNGVIIQGRLDPVAEIVILDAVKNNNYLRCNDLLNTMKYGLGLTNDIAYKGLTTDQITTFQSNSTLKFNFQKQKSVADYLNM